MYKNNDLTPHQIAILNVSLDYDIARLNECLSQNIELNIDENIQYYNKRIKEMNELREIMRNTIGMK